MDALARPISIFAMPTAAVQRVLLRPCRAARMHPRKIRRVVGKRRIGSEPIPLCPVPCPIRPRTNAPLAPAHHTAAVEVMKETKRKRTKRNRRLGIHPVTCAVGISTMEKDCPSCLDSLLFTNRRTVRNERNTLLRCGFRRIPRFQQ